MRKTSLATLLATTFLCACAGNGEGEVQNNDQSVAGTVMAGVISLPVSIDGMAPQPFIVDTGSVLTRLDPNRFSALGLTPGLGQVATMDIGSVHLTQVDIFAAELCNEMTMMCRGTEPAGLLGGNVLVNERFTIDYHASTVTFGDFTPPSDVGVAMAIPFVLEGGGEGMIAGVPVTLPATRISITVIVEGMTLPMILDTGSSTMVLRPDVYDAIVADGRPQSTISLGTVQGSQSVAITDLHTVTLAGETQMDVEAVRAPLDLGLLEAEVGHPVAGLLGGRFLEHYVTTVDYPARVLTLQAYED